MHSPTRDVAIRRFADQFGEPRRNAERDMATWSANVATVQPYSGWAWTPATVRRIPFGPPSNVQFQGRATLVGMDAPEIVALLERGLLK